MMRKIIFITIMCAFVAIPAMAEMTLPAEPPTMTGPYLGGSWWINATAPGPYDLYAVRISPPSVGVDTFESPALRNVSNGSWSMVLDGPSLASMAGPPDSLTWSVYFAGATPPPLLEIDHVFFLGETRLYGTHWVLVNGSIYNSGGSWRFSDDWSPTRAEVVPVPGAVLLGILGLGAAGWKLRRFA